MGWASVRSCPARIALPACRERSAQACATGLETGAWPAVPAIAGATFSFGVKRGYVIIPWWTLCVMAALTAVPTFWIEETDGFKGHDADEDDDDAEEGDSESGEHDHTDQQHR